jgi:hypothetical protein
MYRKWNGANQTWDSAGTALTSDGDNNLYPEVPPAISSQGTVPYVWMNGTSSPYTINYGSFSTAVIISNATATVPYTAAALAAIAERAAFSLDGW